MEQKNFLNNLNFGDAKRDRFVNDTHTFSVTVFIETISNLSIFVFWITYDHKQKIEPY